MHKASAFPEELLELRLCCCAGVLEFVIIIEISINFLDLKKLKIKKQKTDKMQLTHFRMVPSFYFPWRHQMFSMGMERR